MSDNESLLLALNRLTQYLEADFPLEVASSLARQLLTASLQRDTRSIESARKLLDDLHKLAPPAELAEIPGVEPFHNIHAAKKFSMARQQGMVTMLRAFLARLPNPTPLAEHLSLVEQAASGVEVNDAYGGKRGQDVAFRQGVAVAKNGLVLLFNSIELTNPATIKKEITLPDSNIMMEGVSRAEFQKGMAQLQRDFRSEMKEMEIRLQDHSFNGHKSIWGSIGGVEERLSKVEGRLTKVETRLGTIESDIRGIKRAINRIAKRVIDGE